MNSDEDAPGQGNCIFAEAPFFPLPWGRGGDPSRQRWEGEGELPPPRLLQETARKRHAPSPSPACGSGAPPLPHGGGDSGPLVGPFGQPRGGRRPPPSPEPPPLLPPPPC